MELKEGGHEFLTEAIFQNGTRADVLDLTERIIYEKLPTRTKNNKNQVLKL